MWEGASASDCAIRAPADWLSPENQQDMFGTVKRDRQENIFQHIEGNIAHCTIDQLEDTGKEPGAQYEVGKIVLLLLDALDEHRMTLRRVRSSKAQCHMRQIKNILTGTIEEHSTQS